MNKKTSILDIIKSKNQRKLVCTTAYSYPVSKIASELLFDILLIGDSLGMVVQGFDNTINVTLDDILYHTRAVVRGNKNCFIVSDMPFLTTDKSIYDSVQNAGILIQKGGADAVKIEGNKYEHIKAIVNAGIPVMGHIGLNPQKILKMGKYSVQGKTKEEEKTLLNDAKELQEAGVFSLVLECVPSNLGKLISESVDIPTIGIGAGKYCNGEILVSNDIFGLTFGLKPKFVKQYANVAEEIKSAFSKYKEEVENLSFPGDENIYQS